MWLIPHKEEDDLFLDFTKDLRKVFGDSFAKITDRKPRGYPLMDYVREENNLVVQATLPGVKNEDLNVEVSKTEQGQVLTITGRLSKEYVYNEKNYAAREFSSKEFSRSVLLPPDISEEDPESSLKDGVLKLKFKTKQKQPESNVKKININSV